VVAEAVDAPVELGVGERGGAADERRPIRDRVDGVLEQIPEVVSHAG
jgi:hypothetical protein